MWKPRGNAWRHGGESWEGAEEDPSNRAQSTEMLGQKMLQSAQCPNSKEQKLLWGQGGVWKTSGHCWDMSNQ